MFISGVQRSDWVIHTCVSTSTISIFFFAVLFTVMLFLNSLVISSVMLSVFCVECVFSLEFWKLILYFQIVLFRVYLFFLCFKFLILRNITFLSQRIVNILILKSLNTFLFLFCCRESMYWLSVLLSFLSLNFCGAPESGLPISLGLSLPLSVRVGQWPLLCTSRLPV